MDAVVSIIIPNYNHARFLRRRIESVLNQSYQNFELIVLDDCSTDNSKAIIDSYSGHPKITHIVYNDENSGSTFKQWNKGVKLTNGKYIWIAESDDYADESFLEKCMYELLNDKFIGVAYTDCYDVDSENIIAGRWSKWQKVFTNNLWESSFTKKGSEINSNYNYLYNVIPNASCAVFKKQLYITAKFLSEIENLKYTGDWRMWFSMMQNCDIHYCNLPLNYFRYHELTTRSKPGSRLESVLEQYQSVNLFKKTVKINHDRKAEKSRFRELFAMWSPHQPLFFNQLYFKIFIEALKADKLILLRIGKGKLKYWLRYIFRINK